MERTRRIKRSDAWDKIYAIVKTLPREKVEGDSPDAPSITTSLEKLFFELSPKKSVQFPTEKEKSTELLRIVTEESVEHEIDNKNDFACGFLTACNWIKNKSV